MAINIKKFIDISTSYPTANVAGRSFGGLVFSAAEILPQTDPELVKAHNTLSAGGVAYLSLDEIGALFGAGEYNAEMGEYTVEPSDEYKFAMGYYGYLSPSGRIASRLAVAKVLDNETPLAAFTRVNNLTNLFGSFTFLSLAGSDDSSSARGASADLAALKEVATFNAGLQTKYLFVINRVRGDSTASAVVEESSNFVGINGTAFVSGATTVSAYMPMAILGSTDYNNGSVVNFMFKQFGNEVPTVTDDSTYELFNKNYINFYGRTQTNGQTVDFYQRGYNMDGIDTSIYCNELWFKSACETQLFTLLTGSERLPANGVGVSRVSLAVTDVANIAQNNGAFMPKDSVSNAETAKIRELLSIENDDPNSVDDIVASLLTIGYSVYAYLSYDGNEYSIVYYVFYGTGDSIRFIKGNDILVK